jgi:hypothetical protein
MSYNGSGTFNINTAGQPVVTGTVITSTAFNALTADLASGLTTALTKDGQTTPTANIPMGTFKITGLGAGTALTDAAQFGQLQAGATQIAVVTGTDTLAGTLTPTPTAYATGNLFSFVAVNTNTGAATINLNSLGAKSITKLGSTALAAGDIVSGRIYLIEYDGTRFQLINPSASSVSSFSAGTTGFTPSTATTGAVTLAGTLATTNGGTGLTSFTANGVVYASSSSVLATGSALTFDGTTLGSTFLNIGSASSFQTNSRVAIQTSAGKFDIAAYGGSSVQLMSTGALAFYTPSSSFDQIWLQGGSEQMRLTSTGLGIGTSSPAYKLDVNGSGNILRIINSSTSSALMLATNSGASSILVLGNESTTAGSSATGSASYAGLLFTTGTKPLQFGTNSTIQATLDSSGNLGLGVTPSAWNSSSKALQTSFGAFYQHNTAEVGIVANSFRAASGFTYQTTSFAGIFRFTSGEWQWFNAPSGTAGNTVTYTQAMTLDASGYLLVGATSSVGVGANRLQVGSSGASSQLLLKTSTGHSGFYVTGTDVYQTWISGGFLAFGEAPSNGATFTERARIDSSGNFLVGTTSASLGPTSGFNVIQGGGVTGTSIGHITGSSSGSYFELFAYNGSAIGSITQSGTTAVQYNVMSDQRAKENIQDAASASSLIDALQVRQFDWKSDASHQRYGFIAQELVTIAPEAVHQPADPDDMMAVDYSKLVPMLVKEIQSLRKRLAAAGI